MANVFIQDSTMTAIGDAIRAKTGGTAKILPANMATEIAAIETGSDIQMIDGMEIALDLSTGDQPLVAPDGYAVKSATIKKPTTLVPENIADGVNIAGVVGTLASGGESGEMCIRTLARFNGLPSYTSSNPITGSVTLWMPEDAVVEWASLYSHVYSGTSNVGTIQFGPTEYTTTETPLPTYPGYKQVVFLEYSVANSSAKACSSRDYGGSVAIVKIPNAYIKDNILYAGENCKGVLLKSGSVYAGNGLRDSLYFEGIDLRGSQVRYLPDNFGQGHQELKKIWFSEVFDKFDNSSTFDYCENWLEELHFTATTPATVSSSALFSGLNASCKIYVPAGTLAAYTSAANYPSASKHTYIEE